MSDFTADTVANKEFGRLEPVEYDDYPSSSPAPKSKSRRTPKPPVTYSSDSLRHIGLQCQNRLPPASAVQAMFLYEFQRQTESEELFHAHMFNVAQQETEAVAEKEYIRHLEKRVVKLEKQAVHDRVAATDARLKVQIDKLKTCSSRVDTVDEKLVAVDATLEKLKTQAAEAAAAIASQKTEKAAVPERDPMLATAKEEIDVLFVDRDNILVMIEDAKMRLTKVEDNIRTLTLQRAAPAKSPGMTQRLPLSTSNGSQLELGVPKGHAHVGLEGRKENGFIRSFSPGQDWK